MPITAPQTLEQPSTRPNARQQSLNVRRSIRADAIASLGWISSAVAIALYLADGGLRSIPSVGSAVQSLGVVAALVATNAMLLMLTLAARIPVIDRTIGQVKAIEWHRNLGNIVVIGVVIHALAALVGYALITRETIVEAFTDFWSTDFALAVLGLILLIAVAVTSIVAVRHRLRYEVWHLIHLLSYAAIIVSIPHMFSMSSLFAPGKWQRTYWIALLAATGICLLVFRLLVPIHQTLKYGLRIAEVTQVGRDTYNFILTGRRLDTMKVKAGQYFNWRFLTRKLWAQAHPVSLSASPDGRSLRMTVRVVGDGTAAMVKAPIGTRVAIEGPYGVFTDDSRTREALVLVGAGSGIAPIRALLESTTALPERTTVILRSSTPEGLMLSDEFRAICQRRGIRLHLLVGHRAPGRWVPQDHADHTLLTLVPDLKEADLFICGPDGFIRTVLDEARSCGVQDDQLHDERFTW